MTSRGLARSWRPWLRGTAIGFPFGACRRAAPRSDLPLLRHREAADQAPRGVRQGRDRGRRRARGRQQRAVAGVLVPLLTLGMPTSATAAILLAAFQNYGLQPGPLLFDRKASWSGA